MPEDMTVEEALAVRAAFYKLHEALDHTTNSSPAEGHTATDLTNTF